ncbi:hypothetical protein BGZ94_005160 [Podila epigama]|nr:hypothetical protein BGZ94_005160 [Podila epigama]
MNPERDMKQQQQEQDWDKPRNKNQEYSQKSQSMSQNMSSDLRELPVDAATPSASGSKDCSCVGPCDCAMNHAIRASEEHTPSIGRKPDVIYTPNTTVDTYQVPIVINTKLPNPQFAAERPGPKLDTKWHQ